MTLLQGLVASLGLAAVITEFWYFLGPRTRKAGVRKATASQEIKVLVRGGYEPDSIIVESGRPVSLHFYRDESVPCSEKIVFDRLGIERDLAPYETTIVNFTPEVVGDYPFRCGESTLRGRVIARPRGSIRYDGADLKGHGAHD